MNDEGRNRAVLAVFLLAWLVVGASIVALLSPPTLQDIREHRRMAQWPVVAATITQPRVQPRHFDATRRQPALDAWCAGWFYDYTWQGRHHGGVLDDASGLLPGGCFLHEAGARQAADKRAPGTVVSVRVDPASPWTSTTQSADIPAGDIAALALITLPMLPAIGGLVMVARQARSARRSADPRTA